jgi:hypothetical protein
VVPERKRTGRGSWDSDGRLGCESGVITRGDGDCDGGEGPIGILGEDMIPVWIFVFCG